mgnify:CR=1 FL=1
MKVLNTLYELFHNSIEKFSQKTAFSMFGGEDVIGPMGVSLQWHFLRQQRSCRGLRTIP